MLLAFVACTLSPAGSVPFQPFAFDSGTTDSSSPAEDTSNEQPPLVCPAGTDCWTLYATRHAEKEDEGEDPALTVEGQARAEALATRMAEVPLVAVYATDLIRTQQTVQPTATAKGLPVEIEADPEEALAARIVAEHPTDAVLHAGHSYTLPGLFYALNMDEGYVDGYGQLWIILGDSTGALVVNTEHVGE